MRLRHTNNTRPSPNELEEVYINGWSLIEDETFRLMDESWKMQKRGKQVRADQLNEAANYLTYLFYYAQFIRSWVDRQGLIDDQCTATLIEDKFKIVCVEKNLSCLSANLGTDYVNVWKDLLSIFNITRQKEGCDSGCCLGIGEMFINDPDDCIALIVGPCEENIVEEEEIGEYEDCAYDDSHTNADENASCDIDINCN